MVDILIYISGIVPAYLMQRVAFKKYTGGEWTNISRGMGLFCAAISWYGFVVSLTQYLILLLIDREEKNASW